MPKFSADNETDDLRPSKNKDKVADVFFINWNSESVQFIPLQEDRELFFEEPLPRKPSKNRGDKDERNGGFFQNVGVQVWSYRAKLNTGRLNDPKKLRKPASEHAFVTTPRFNRPNSKSEKTARDLRLLGPRALTPISYRPTCHPLKKHNGLHPTTEPTTILRSIKAIQVDMPTLRKSRARATPRVKPTRATASVARLAGAYEHALLLTDRLAPALVARYGRRFVDEFVAFLRRNGGESQDGGMASVAVVARLVESRADTGSQFNGDVLYSLTDAAVDGLPGKVMFGVRDRRLMTAAFEIFLAGKQTRNV